MKRTILTLAALGTAASLAACGQKQPEKVAEAPTPVQTTAAPSPKTDAMADMPGMGDAAGEKMAKGVGKVAAVDAAAGRVTLDHEAIPEVGWPAMMMAFKANPAILQGVKVGDQVAFDVTVKDGAGEVTAITHH
jgi:Cu(I)/Ag(I) efflux system protein CusF